MSGYKDALDCFEDLWHIVTQGRQTNRDPLDVIVRGVLRLREDPQILAFLYRTLRLLVLALLEVKGRAVGEFRSRLSINANSRVGLNTKEPRTNLLPFYLGFSSGPKPRDHGTPDVISVWEHALIRDNRLACGSYTSPPFAPEFIRDSSSIVRVGTVAIAGQAFSSRTAKRREQQGETKAKRTS